jgi:hypothetical protein
MELCLCCAILDLKAFRFGAIPDIIIVDDDNWEKNILFAVIDKYIDKGATCATFFIQFKLVNNKIHRQNCH